MPPHAITVHTRPLLILVPGALKDDRGRVGAAVRETDLLGLAGVR